MSRRKKWTFAAAAATLILLIVFTAVSYQNNNRLMPRVKTFTFRFDDSCKTDYKWYLPEDCIMSDGKGNCKVYRLKDRMGRFGKEYYTEEVLLHIYSENGEKQYREADGHLRVEAPEIWEGDKIVYECDQFFAPKETVKWVNTESDE